MTPADTKLQHESLLRLRARGESLHSRALVEDDLTTGLFRWGNEYFLTQTGYTLAQLQQLTVFALMPSVFQEELRERLAGKRSSYFVAAIFTATGQVSWWLAHDVEEHYPVHWSEARHLRTTEQSGHDFDVMTAVAEVTNAAGVAFRDHEEVHDELRTEIARLDETNLSTKREVAALRQDVARATSAARDAANAAFRIDQSVKDIRSLHENLESKVSSEILRLIKTDQVYETQFEEFQAQLKIATARARDSIQAAAKDAGKTISSRVSFPVGVFGGLAVIVNHLLEHPEIMAKVLGLFGLAR